MVHPASQVRRLLADQALRPRRDLGQNFLADPNTARRVARLAELSAGDHVAEIGAGLGALTVELAATGARVLAVETDGRLLDALRAAVTGAAVDVVHGDALRLDWGHLLGESAEWSVAANLPYNVAVPIVLRLLDEVPAVTRMLVMVQREVAERLASPPGSKAYGAVSVHVAYWATAEVVGAVPASVFVPRPHVESALVRIVRRPAPAVDPAIVDRQRLLDVVRCGFQQRRKMLRRSLAGVVGEDAFRRAGIDPSRRAEELDVEEWGRLAR